MENSYGGQGVVNIFYPAGGTCLTKSTRYVEVSFPQTQKQLKDKIELNWTEIVHIFVFWSSYFETNCVFVGIY